MLSYVKRIDFTGSVTYLPVFYNNTLFLILSLIKHQMYGSHTWVSFNFRLIKFRFNLHEWRKAVLS